MKTLFRKRNRYKLNKKSKSCKINKTIQNKDFDENNIMTNPIENIDNNTNSQIISGYFLDEKPYKEMVIQRVNNILYGILIFLVSFCFICYYFVSCKEVQLNQISRETLELNYENEELQNKVDTLQSYYNIDKAVSKNNILERAKHVVEVNAVDMPNLNFNKGVKKSSFVVSY